MLHFSFHDYLRIEARVLDAFFFHFLSDCCSVATPPTQKGLFGLPEIHILRLFRALTKQGMKQGKTSK
jgi:hypothetical protein